MSKPHLKNELYKNINSDISSLLPLEYSFKYKNLSFHCEITHHQDGTYALDLLAKLGHLPYSSENHLKRCELLRKLGPLKAKKIVKIDHHCAITLPVRTSFNTELTAETLMTAITITLLDMGEIIDVILGTSKDISAHKISA